MRGLILALVCGCASNPSSLVEGIRASAGPGQSGDTHLKVMYMPSDSGAPVLPLRLDGKPVLIDGRDAVTLGPNSLFGTSFAPGTYAVTLGNSTPVRSALESHAVNSILFFGESNALAIKQWVDDNHPPADRTLHVRVVNLTTDRRALDVTYSPAGAAPQTLVAGLAFGDEADFDCLVPTDDSHDSPLALGSGGNAMVQALLQFELDASTLGIFGVILGDGVTTGDGYLKDGAFPGPL